MCFFDDFSEVLGSSKLRRWRCRRVCRAECAKPLSSSILPPASPFSSVSNLLLLNTAPVTRKGCAPNWARRAGDLGAPPRGKSFSPWGRVGRRFGLRWANLAWIFRSDHRQKAQAQWTFSQFLHKCKQIRVGKAEKTKRKNGNTNPGKIHTLPKSSVN